MAKRRPKWLDQNPLPVSAQGLLKEAARQGKPHTKERLAALDKAIARVKQSYPQLFKWS